MFSDYGRVFVVVDGVDRPVQVKSMDDVLILDCSNLVFYDFGLINLIHSI